MSQDFDINNLNKTFESRIRLGIMSVLSVNENVDFNSLKNLLNVTDGNLASHISALEKSEYLIVRKEFAGKKPRTTYRITDVGRIAFAQHVSFLEELIIKNTNK